MRLRPRALVLSLLCCGSLVPLLLSDNGYSQVTAADCAAANADLPGQIARADAILAVKHPAHVPPVDFPDECWGKDAAKDAARQRIVNDFVKNFQSPELPLMLAIARDAHVLDTMHCWTNSFSSDIAQGKLKELATYLQGRILDFMNDNSGSRTGFKKAAILGASLLPIERQCITSGGNQHDDFLTHEASMYANYMGDIVDRIKRNHDLSLIPTFEANFNSATVAGAFSNYDETQRAGTSRGAFVEYDHTLADATQTKVDVDFTFQVTKSGGKFIYEVQGYRKLKYHSALKKWADIDFTYTGGELSAPDPIIQLAYLQGTCEANGNVDKMVLCERTDNVRDAAGNVNSTTSPVNCTFTTTCQIVPDPCSQSGTPFAFKILDLGAQREKWKAIGRQTQEYYPPMTLAGFANTFMSNYIDDDGKTFIFKPTNFQNKQVQFVDEKFQSNLVAQIRDICELHLTITHHPL